MSDKLKMVLSLMAMVVLVSLIDVYTIKKYNINSGNGNPALAVIAVLLPIAGYSAYLLHRYIKSLTPHWMWTIIAIPVSLAYSIWGYYHQVNHFYFIQDQLSQYFDYQEVLFKIQGITIFNNTVYFNFVTLLMYISWVICFSLVIVRFKKSPK
ncbi:MAG: hypothetical protein ACOWWO_11085 [Peptococcaceae bacterium]